MNNKGGQNYLGHLHHCMNYLCFKNGVWKSTVILFKICFCYPPSHPIQCWNSGEMSNIVGGVGGGAEQVYWKHAWLFVWRVWKSATSANLSQDFCPWLSEFELENKMSLCNQRPCIHTTRDQSLQPVTSCKFFRRLITETIPVACKILSLYLIMG